MRVVITHGHIFKNAGTTLDWALRRNFGDGFCDHRDDVPMRRRRGEYLQEFLAENPGIQALSSHHLCDTAGLHEIRCLPIYLLRHPLLRVLSVYRFERKQKSDSPGAEAAKKYDFKDYVKWRMDPNVGRTIRDYQVYYLGSNPAVPNETVLGVKHLERAARRFHDGSFVGLVEDFDKSMTLVENELKSYFPDIDLSYVRQNTGEVRSGSERSLNYLADELGDMFDLLVESNSLDLTLYRMAKESLSKKIEKLGSFDQKLSDYRGRCEVLAQGRKAG